MSKQQRRKSPHPKSQEKKDFSALVTSPERDRRFSASSVPLSALQVPGHGDKRDKTYDRKGKADSRASNRSPSPAPATHKHKSSANFLSNFDIIKLSCKPTKQKNKNQHRSSKGKKDSSGLSRLDIAQLWQHYDKNNNGLLDPPELEQLAEDIFEWIPHMYRTMLRLDHPRLSERQLEQLVINDLPHIMPSSHKSVVSTLSRELPFNFPQNRKIREQEFVARWNHAAGTIFKNMHVDDQATLACCFQ